MRARRARACRAADNALQFRRVNRTCRPRGSLFVEHCLTKFGVRAVHGLPVLYVGSVSVRRPERGVCCQSGFIPHRHNPNLYLWGIRPSILCVNHQPAPERPGKCRHNLIDLTGRHDRGSRALTPRQQRSPSLESGRDNARRGCVSRVSRSMVETCAEAFSPMGLDIRLGHPAVNGRRFRLIGASRLHQAATHRKSDLGQ